MELYDHNKDHNEWLNQATNPEYESIKNKLVKYLPEFKMLPYVRGKEGG